MTRKKGTRQHNVTRMRHENSSKSQRFANGVKPKRRDVISMGGSRTTQRQQVGRMQGQRINNKPTPSLSNKPAPPLVSSDRSSACPQWQQYAAMNFGYHISNNCISAGGHDWITCGNFGGHFNQHQCEQLWEHSNTFYYYNQMGYTMNQICGGGSVGSGTPQNMCYCNGTAQFYTQYNQMCAHGWGTWSAQDHQSHDLTW